jgi:CRP/FNR family transcriptional regulator
MKKIRCMKDLEIFSALDFTERERIGALARKRVYRKNEFVFREGEPADAIYLIKYGRVKLFKVSGEGREIILDILKEDDMFGENTFFEDTVHTMSAQAMEDTFVCSCKGLLRKNSGNPLINWKRPLNLSPAGTE